MQSFYGVCLSHRMRIWCSLAVVEQDTRKVRLFVCKQNAFIWIYMKKLTYYEHVFKMMFYSNDSFESYLYPAFLNWLLDQAKVGGKEGENIIVLWYL